MRYGIVSDIHGNLEGLTAALTALGEIDVLICPGDIVGYGPDPNACCEIIRERNAICVLGNHDAVMVGELSLNWFNPVAAEALLWTREQITDENLSFLKELPLVHWNESFVLVHSSLSAPEEFDYITTAWDARPTFAEMGSCNLCIIGHTHIAEYYYQKVDGVWASRINMTPGGRIVLKEGVRYIVNSGSTGQPRDFDPRASAALYDSEAGTIDILRVEYPISLTQQKMRAAGLPEPLVQRLQYGT